MSRRSAGLQLRDGYATVENDGTFYRLPASETFADWRRTPDDFVMAFKASRYLTHIRRLRDPAERRAADGQRLGAQRLAPSCSSCRRTCADLPLLDACLIEFAKVKAPGPIRVVEPASLLVDRRG